MFWHNVNFGRVQGTCKLKDKAINPNKFRHTLFQSQPVKSNLNKKLDPKEKTIQAFNIDAKGFRKSRNENPPSWEVGVTC